MLYYTYIIDPLPIYVYIVFCSSREIPPLMAQPFFDKRTYIFPVSILFGPKDEHITERTGVKVSSKSRVHSWVPTESKFRYVSHLYIIIMLYKIRV